MNDRIQDIINEILALGLQEIPVANGTKQVHKFVNYATGVEYTTYNSGYVRRSHTGYTGKELLSINSVKKTLWSGINPAFKLYTSEQILLETEEFRLIRLLVYLKKNIKKS